MTDDANGGRDPVSDLTSTLANLRMSLSRLSRVEEELHRAITLLHQAIDLCETVRKNQVVSEDPKTWLEPRPRAGFSGPSKEIIE
jgi:hypothetical protein